MNLGEVITIKRMMNNCDIRTAANDIGISFSTLSRMENGLISKDDNLKRVMNYYEITELYASEAYNDVTHFIDRAIGDLYLEKNVEYFIDEVNNLRNRYMGTVPTFDLLILLLYSHAVGSSLDVEPIEYIINQNIEKLSATQTALYYFYEFKNCNKTKSKYLGILLSCITKNFDWKLKSIIYEDVICYYFYNNDCFRALALIDEYEKNNYLRFDVKRILRILTYKGKIYFSLGNTYEAQNIQHQLNELRFIGKHKHRDYLELEVYSLFVERRFDEIVQIVNSNEDTICHLDVLSKIIVIISLFNKNETCGKEAIIKKTYIFDKDANVNTLLDCVMQMQDQIKKNNIQCLKRIIQDYKIREMNLVAMMLNDFLASLYARQGYYQDAYSCLLEYH